jgi:Domain of unknown function (DUF6602)
MKAGQEPKRLRPRPVPVFNNRFAAALRFGAAFLETSAVSNTGIKGTKREDAFRGFMAERLPKRYGIATGEVVDQFARCGTIVVAGRNGDDARGGSGLVPRAKSVRP